MRQKTSNLIWYACYGSNMDEGRFLKYIQGGVLRVNGVPKTYTACENDKSDPKESEPYLIDRQFYFANESTTWDKHGVGFISNEKDENCKTFAKLYLISKVQFLHLFTQENSLKTVKIDFDKLFKHGILNFKLGFYNRIVQLDKNYKGHPILTFTSKKESETNKPHLEYVRLIANGLKMTHNLTDKEVVDYLGKKGTGAKKSDVKKVFHETTARLAKKR